jgi:hypothetical protein
MERFVTKSLHSYVRFKAIHLSAESISPDRYVHEFEGLNPISIYDVLGQHDHAGAGPEDGHPAVNHLFDPVDQTVGKHQLAYGCALTAGDDQPTQTAELLRQTNGEGFYVKPAQNTEVLSECALGRQDTDLHLPASDGKQVLGFYLLYVKS